MAVEKRAVGEEGRKKERCKKKKKRWDFGRPALPKREVRL
jgi:hypothetical protein